jgi:AcrR family transcriptional regulator
MEQGFSAVSHRAVAERAGVPLSATTYYFRSLDDLLTATVERLAGTWLAAAREAVDRFAGPGELRDVADAVLSIALLTPPAAVMPIGPACCRCTTAIWRQRAPPLQVLIATYDRDLDHLISTVLSRAGLPHDLAPLRLCSPLLTGRSCVPWQRVRTSAPPATAWSRSWSTCQLRAWFDRSRHRLD